MNGSNVAKNGRMQPIRATWYPILSMNVSLKNQGSGFHLVWTVRLT